MPFYKTTTIIISFVVLLTALFLSCGGTDESVLAHGHDIEVTVDDFKNEFEKLSPSDQVSALETDGKLNLVTTMINRQILLAEVETEMPPGLEEWLDIYETSWLSRKWVEQELELINEEGFDSTWITDMISTDVSFSAVLLPDSNSAVVVLEDWRINGPSEPDIEMATAIWSIRGSSYLSFEGDLFRFLIGDPNFAKSILPYAGKGFVIVPAFGSWAVCRFDTVHSDQREFSIDAVARHYVSYKLSEPTSVTVLSGSIEILAAHLENRNGKYIFVSLDDLNPELVIATFSGGELTVGEVVSIVRMMNSDNYFGDIPDDLSSLEIQKPLLDPEVDLWIYVKNLARNMNQAHLARELGLVWPREELELTATEHVLRVAVLEPVSDIDTLTALEFYRNHPGAYLLPEMRSIRIAYIRPEWLGSDEIISFSDLERYYSTTDSLGKPIPTPAYPRELFNPIGDAVFEADSGIFTGPVEVLEDGMYAFFEVVEIVQEGEAEPESILPVLMDDCRYVQITQLLEAYLLELWTEYRIEIDSTAVKNVDPWASIY